jgi:pSer/pThr/pTyr-binding forkhead associated (FHA) protein
MNMPRLVISGAAHELTGNVITIGRAPDNMIVIDDPSVSGRHAQLRLAGEVYRLKDLESTNGTRINGIPVTETALRFGDRIRFGAVDALFEPDMRGSQPLPQLEELEAKPAESSVAPVDFTNASPFPRRKQRNDPIRTVILATAAGALLVFLGSMIALLMMRAPVL